MKSSGEAQGRLRGDVSLGRQPARRVRTLDVSDGATVMGVSDYRAGLRALAEGRHRDAVASLTATRDLVKPGSLLAAAATRGLAEALAAAGAYEQAVDAANAALDLVLAIDGSGARRQAEAWTTLGLTTGWAEVGPRRSQDSLSEAETLVRNASLGGCICAIRVRRLRAGALSASGDQGAARAVLNELGRALASGTRRARREALHVEAVAALVRLRSSDVSGAAAMLAVVAENRAALLGPTHPETLTALHNRAVALRRTSDRRDALPVLQAVARDRTEILGPDHPDTLTTRSFLALQQAEGGATDAAVRDIEAVLASARRRLGDRHTVAFQIASRVASILDMAGRPAGALAVLEEWASRAREALGAEHAEAASLLHAYGNTLHQIGRLASAYQVFGELADATRRAKGENHIETVASYNSLAVVASDLGDVATAEALYWALLAAFSELGPGHALDEASVRNNLAHLLLTAGRSDVARPLFEAVLKVREERLEPRHRLLHLSRSNLAATLAKSGRSEKALELHRRVLADRTEAFGPRHPDRLASLHSVGATLSDLGRAAEAIPILEEACGVRREVLGEAHANTVASMRALADAHLAVGCPDEAERVLRAVRKTVEGLRHLGDLPDDMRRGLFAQYVPAYRALALLASERGDADELFAIAEAVKARTLIERTAARSGLRKALLSEEALQRWRSLERRIGTLEAHIPTVVDPVARNAVVVERDRLLADWRGLQASLEERSTAYREASAVLMLGLEEGRALLAPDQAFLSYVAHGDRLAAVWLGPAGLTGCCDLGTVPSLPRTAWACREVLAQPDGLSGLLSEGVVAWRRTDGAFDVGASATMPSDARILRHDHEILEALSQALLGALPRELFRATRLLVSMDGPLSMLPFEALRFEGRPLLATCEVTYLPSLAFMATVTEDRRPRASDAIPMIAVGAPRFASDGLATTLDGPLASAARGSSKRTERWAELPGAAAELAAIAGVFSLEEGATLFTGSSASLATVRDLSASGALARAQALLFSTHGYLDPSDPRRNALVLASGPDGEADLLTAAELASYELSADLVVLSACDTGAGDFLAGEGVLGLPFALIIAGSRSVVQTLWPVFDDAAAALVASFLAEYRAGTGASAALTSAKRRMATGELGPDYRAAANWAPFLIYGR